MDTTVADPFLGALLDGRYRVRGRVARGGMATVYSAIDERLERTVALKIIHPGQSHDPNFVDRFTDEAKTIARLTHPNVVAVYDQGSHQGLPYLVMEYVRGRTLREVLAERRRLQPQEALAILEQMLAAIGGAHRAGLVHRDVKPENVLVAESPTGGTQNLVDSVVKVADFGLARAVEASADEGSAHLMATVAYVAPELVTDGHADPRTDVYSAGVVLFEMLTGRVPYEGDRPVDVAWQHVDRDVPPPSRYVPGLPEILDELVFRATSRNPSGRPTDAGALLVEVQAVRDELGAELAQRSRPLAQPTVVVPQVEAVPHRRMGVDRPSWARLPSPRPRPLPYQRQPAGGRSSPPAAGLRTMLDQINANPRGRIALAAALLTLGLLVAVGGWWFGVGRYTDAPGLVELSKDVAVQQASAGGFRVAYDRGEYHEQVNKDVVLRQRPGPGERIVSGGTITLTLSLGPERYKVPDIAGRPYDLAVEDLKVLKLQVTRKDAYDDNIPQGSVVRTDPAIGTEVKPGQAIVVFVSVGASPLKVPNVIGRNVGDAEQILRDRKLGIKVTAVVESDKPKDEVLTQTPTEGAGATEGQIVEVTISKGPATFQMPDVRGMSADDAKRTLEGMNLKVRVVGGGTVRFQQPDAGQQVQAGQEVTIFAFA